jgi:hypothetical protein
MFTISCGAVLLLVGGPANVPGTSQQVAALFPIALLVTLAGPSVAGILLTGLVER